MLAIPKKQLVPALAVIAGIFVILQISYDIHSYRQAADSAYAVPITNLIYTAIAGQDSIAPINAVSGKVYIPQDHLVFPAETNSPQQIMYTSDPASSSDSLLITTTQLITQGESRLWTAQTIPSGQGAKLSAMFQEVPNLQACARGVHLDSKAQPASSGLISQGSVTLANRQKLYLYTEASCKEDISSLVRYIKQVQSY